MLKLSTYNRTFQILNIPNNYESSVMVTNFMTQQSKQYDDFFNLIKMCVPISLFEEIVAYNYLTISKLEQLEPFLKISSLFGLLPLKISFCFHSFV